MTAKASPVPLEFDALLDAFSQAFVRAQAAIEAGQVARMQAELASERAALHALIPARPVRIHELKIEFDCTALVVRVEHDRRLALRLGRRPNRPCHRVCLALHAGEPATARLDLDGEQVRTVNLPEPEPTRSGSDLGPITRKCPDLVLVSLRDTARVAAILAGSGPR